ncbi:MAG TPA: MerR family transcriptional regulator [Microbacteriaceae bacterium]|nr:MerR family transcriptional regulator [Microbacteriaceae bacterium]
MEYSIQEVARAAGTTSRTLRHYDDIGLLAPTRVADNGYRYYDETALVRLQRILVLRGLGLGLPAIAGALARDTDAAGALRSHVQELRAERGRLARQITAVERTLAAIEQGGEIAMDTMFDGFDHAGHREEVERRWGADAYARSAAWWESKSPEERARWQDELHSLNQDWIGLAAAGAAASGEPAQALAERHVAWLASIPGTPTTDVRTRAAYVRGLAAMYAADPRFAANYGGGAGAAFVREALEHYAAERL